VLQSGTGSLSGGVHHWLKSRSAREEIKPVMREHNNNNDDDDDDDDNNNSTTTLKRVEQKTRPYFR
jgi:hypothetical protein